MSHALLSPSGWDRWSVCPGSVAACAGLPDETSSYADEGTAAHWVLEQVLQLRYSQFFGDESATADQFLGREVNAADEGKEPRLITVGQEMIDHINDCLDFIAARVALHRTHGDTRVVTEHKVNPVQFLRTSDCRGTADVTIASPRGVEILDLKYGKGVVVEIQDPETEHPNGQLMIYLLGVISETRTRVTDEFTFTIGILQPRAYHAAGPFRVLDLSHKQVHAFQDRAKAAIAAALALGAPRVASPKGCRFCRAKGKYAPAICQSYVDMVVDTAALPPEMDFDVVKFVATADPNYVDPVLLVRILDARDLIKGMLSAAEDWAAHQLTLGTAPFALTHAYKLVEGRSNRRWAFEPETVVQGLKKLRWPSAAPDATGKASIGLKKTDYMEEKVRSPTQVEAVLKRYAKEGTLTATHMEAFQRLVEKPEGALKLVPVSDDRQSKGAGSLDVMFDAAVLAPAPDINNPFLEV